MATIAVIVEGDDDEVAIPALVKRCRKGVKVVARQCRGPVQGKFLGIVAELNRAYHPERVLVISDADGRRPEEVRRAIEVRRTRDYRFPVIPIVIVEMLEAWLIADPEALEKVVGSRKEFPSPETLRDPKRELVRLLSRNSAYTPATARRLAEAVKLEVLKARCPRFAKFLSAVLGR